MQPRIFTCLGVLFFGTGLLCARAAGAPATVPATRPALPAAVEECLDWLPKDTQCIAVHTDAAAALAAAETEFTTGKLAASGPPRWYGWTAIMPCPLIGEHEAIAFLREQKVRIMLRGGIRFRREESEVFNIFLLGADAPQLDGIRLKQVFGGERLEMREVRGVRVFQTGLKAVARPRPHVLVVTANARTMDEILARIHTPTAPRALPDSLPEWRHVDFNKPLWALRHFNWTEEKDPTLPFDSRRLRDGDLDLVEDRAVTGITCHMIRGRTGCRRLPS
jgi:hypothetical protein